MSFEGLSADDDTRLVEFSESPCDVLIVINMWFKVQRNVVIVA